MSTQEFQKICTECKNSIPNIWKETICESCMNEKHLEAAIAICSTCRFGSEPCVCGDNGYYLEDEDIYDDDYDEEAESNDFEF